MKKKSIDYLAKLAEHIKNRYANGTIIQDTANYIHNIVTDIADKNGYSGDDTYKLDIFGNSIVVKMLYSYNRNNSFESTYVYHIDFDVDNSIKEYIVVKFDFTGSYDLVDNISKRRKGYFTDAVMAIIHMSLGFRSTMFEDIGDNTKYTMKWVDNNINKLFDTENQIYTIVSQTENYTLSLLITKDSAIIYSLPTKTLSNSETHIEEILVMDHLRDKLGYKVNDGQDVSLSKIPEEEEVNDDVFIYTVRPGDNLTKIAYNYKTTVNEILKYNPDIKDPNLIKIDQSIIIPKVKITALNLNDGSIIITMNNGEVIKIPGIYGGSAMQSE